MNTCIKLIGHIPGFSVSKNWLDNHPRVKQWVWFIGLWMGGLIAVVALSLPIKLLIRMAG